MNNYPFGSQVPKSFHAYPRNSDFDLESGATIKRPKKPKNSSFHPIRMIKSFVNRFHHYFKLHPLMGLFLTLSFGVTVLIFLSFYGSQHRTQNGYSKLDLGSDVFIPFPKLQNLVMVAGHSIYTSSSCGKIEKEESWFLESYQKNPGQAATFVTHIQEGVEIAARDDSALLLFSGGETRKDAGPRSEAQSYWAVADFKGWFGEFLHFC